MPTNRVFLGRKNHRSDRLPLFCTAQSVMAHGGPTSGRVPPWLNSRSELVPCVMFTATSGPPATGSAARLTAAATVKHTTATVTFLSINIASTVPADRHGCRVTPRTRVAPMMRYLPTVVLLFVSNAFMTAAWYGHLKYDRVALWKVILVAWGIALFEYVFQVPANRLGHDRGLTGGQLKIMQEAITLVVFVIFARLYLGERLTWNYYVAFAFVLAAVFMVFVVRPTTGA